MPSSLYLCSDRLHWASFFCRYRHSSTCFLLPQAGPPFHGDTHLTLVRLRHLSLGHHSFFQTPGIGNLPCLGHLISLGLNCSGKEGEKEHLLRDMIPERRELPMNSLTVTSVVCWKHFPVGWKQEAALLDEFVTSQSLWMSEWMDTEGENLQRGENYIEWGISQYVFLIKDIVGSLQTCTKAGLGSKEPSRS